MRTITTTLAAAAMMLLAAPTLAQRAPDRDNGRTTQTRGNDNAGSRNDRNQSSRGGKATQARNSGRGNSAHQTACMRRYASYDKRTDTFAPGRGKPRQRCRG
ncbi:BA14K family protein [Sphingomonas arantia]|uniref:Lectin-like protein BA14k n=1 Tax=Sphingomonas arantia TaxID=1460676 RepID=A0ABW4TYC8_9SPHN